MIGAGARHFDWDEARGLTLRHVLPAALVFVGLGAAWLRITPWLAPARVIEGPLVQQATENSAKIVYFTTRGALTQVSVEAPTPAGAAATESAGNRHVATLSGLAPDRAYAYHIRADGREVARGTFRTNKPAGAEFSFIVFGDSGKGTQVQYELARQMERHVPDFLLHTGDLVYPDGERSNYEARFFAPYRRLISEVAFWPSLGNHDVSEPHFGRPYREVFELPRNGPPGLTGEDNYWFDYAGARVAVIDSNYGRSDDPDSDAKFAVHVAPWLRELFSGAAEKWKFVAMHYPPYTGGEKYRENVVLQRTLAPAFEASGVDIVFCGHNHMYERTMPLRGGQVVGSEEGVIYIVTGAGGAELYAELPSGRRPAYMAKFADDRHSFSLVQVRGDELNFRQIDRNGEVIDQFEVRRHGTAPHGTGSAPAPR